MTGRRRGGFTLVETLVAVSIIGILTGLTVPTFLGIRRSAIAQQALTEVRSVDIAVNASCGRGTCGPFMPLGVTDATVTDVPDALKEFLPSGYHFSRDTATYALELESWELIGNVIVGPPVCWGPTCSGAIAVATTSEDPGFSNTSGFATPPTIYVTVTIVTKDADMAQQLYDKSGGAPPFFVTDAGVWKYSFPVLIGVPATG